MKYYYICDDCLNLAAGGDVKSLTMEEYNKICEKIVVAANHKSSDSISITCCECGGSNMRKLLTPPSSYVRGYGYQDKRGATNDMNLFTMTHGKDPYASSRNPGDKEAIVRKLRKNKEFNPKTKVVHLSPKK